LASRAVSAFDAFSFFAGASTLDSALAKRDVGVGVVVGATPRN
jgi:hypothetical protein